MFATLTSCDRGVCIGSVQDDASFYTHSSSSTIDCSTIYSDESSLFTAVVTVFENGSVLDDIHDEWGASDSTSLSSSSSASFPSAHSPSTASSRRPSANSRNGSGSGNGGSPTESKKTKMIPITTSGYRTDGRRLGAKAGVGIGIGTVISDNLSNSVITVFHGKNRKDRRISGDSESGNTPAVVSPMHSNNGSTTSSNSPANTNTSRSRSDEEAECSGGVEMLRMADDADDSASIILLGQQGDNDDDLLLNQSLPIYSWDEIELEKHEHKEIKQIVKNKKQRMRKKDQRKRQPQQQKQHHTPPQQQRKQKEVDSAVKLDDSIRSRGQNKTVYKTSTTNKTNTSPTSKNRKSRNHAKAMGTTEKTLTSNGDNGVGGDNFDDDCSSVPSLFMVETSIDEYLKVSQGSNSNDNSSSYVLGVQNFVNSQSCDSQLVDKNEGVVNDAAASAATANGNSDGMTLIHNIDRKKYEIGNKSFNVTIKPADTTNGQDYDAKPNSKDSKHKEADSVGPSSPTSASTNVGDTPIDRGCNTSSESSSKKLDYTVYQTSNSYPSFLLSNINNDPYQNSDTKKMTKSSSTKSMAASRKNTVRPPETAKRVQSSHSRLGASGNLRATKEKSSGMIFKSWVDEDDGEEDKSDIGPKLMKQEGEGEPHDSSNNSTAASTSTYRHQFVRTMNWFLCNAGDNLVLPDYEKGPNRAGTPPTTENNLSTNVDSQINGGRKDDDQLLQRLVSFEKIRSP